jgi:hypothetical protein
VVVSDVPPFIVFALTPLWPTAGFLLHFEEGIHVIGNESSSFRFRIVLFRFIEMPAAAATTATSAAAVAATSAAAAAATTTATALKFHPKYEKRKQKR